MFWIFHLLRFDFVTPSPFYFRSVPKEHCFRSVPFRSDSGFAWGNVERNLQSIVDDGWRRSLPACSRCTSMMKNVRRSLHKCLYKPRTMISFVIFVFNICNVEQIQYCYYNQIIIASSSYWFDCCYTFWETTSDLLMLEGINSLCVFKKYIVILYRFLDCFVSTWIWMYSDFSCFFMFYRMGFIDGLRVSFFVVVQIQTITFSMV